MNEKNSNRKFIRKIALGAILTALATVLGLIKIPVVSTATITLVLPVVVVGAALCGPIVGAWLTVVPALVTIFSGEATRFMQYSLVGTVITLILKGLLTGFSAGAVYKLLSVKHPIGAGIAASVVAPIVNSGIFTLGCYIFIWDALVAMATEANVGIGLLLFGLVGMNFIIELVINIILCPTIIRIIQIATNKKLV